jgi:hypothetical protein
MKLKQCRICKSKKLIVIFSLGSQPLANNLLTKSSEKVKKYPLELVQCTHCGFIQLNYVVPKEELFDTYFYIPSVSTTYLSHLDKLSTDLIADLQLQKGNLVIDIGGSDGSFLHLFEQKGMNVVNVEPAKNIASKVVKVNAYLNPTTAKKVVKQYGKAKLATATNVFAHIHDLDEFIASLDVLLDEDGVFFAQFPDVRNLLKENQFDTIYHEHLSYFTYEPLHHLFMNSPFELYKVDNSVIHGGSMRIYVRRRENLLKPFIKNVESIKKDLNLYLINAKAKHKKIAAFGAAAKGMVLLYYCGLDKNIIEYVADGTPYKQGKYTPGTTIPVVPEEELVKNPPDILIILAWNYKEEIIKKVKKLLKKSKKEITFVIPIPRVEIVQ